MDLDDNDVDTASDGTVMIVNFAAVTVIVVAEVSTTSVAFVVIVTAVIISASASAVSVILWVLLLLSSLFPGLVMDAASAVVVVVAVVALDGAFAVFSKDDVKFRTKTCCLKKGKAVVEKTSDETGKSNLIIYKYLN